ncbi:hypothetical protein CLV63_105115 [Murinocardiopsis flavida]|uniref:Uncharacterized protein n=1 Tax=Murinocardiopsis flavida TaxID=645275 RepID=A0A2P8DMK5_9ACTN|nr:hypothetical protein [Murinocardiopsis flavida]PSK98441.1 hypothetical protein CLV63_105115 [Murinocardiopsis flavida]
MLLARRPFRVRRPSIPSVSKDRLRPMSYNFLHGRADDVRARIMRDPFPAVAPHVRVMMVDDPRAMGGNSLAYSVSARCTAVMCVKMGRTETVVIGRDHLHAWGVAKHDVWFAALRNLAAEPVTVTPNESTADVPLYTLYGADWAGSSHVMRLGDVLPAPTPFGAVAMLPGLNSILFAPLMSQRSLAILPMMWLVYQRFTAEDRPVTDQLLWWHNGRLSAMDAMDSAPIDGKSGIHVIESPEFQRMKSALPA